uniref:CLIP domain-containing serine protease n=1 Tax=Glossina pallidipes TaxID=7398 RepID=A0A1A9ZT36_GLOPL
MLKLVVLCSILFNVSDAINFSLTQNYGECLNRGLDKGLCVLLENCEYLVNALLTSPRKEPHREYLSRSQCGMKNGKPLVCCLKLTSRVAPTLDLNSKIALLPRFEQCAQGTTVQTNNTGNIAKVKQYPWMALLEHTKGNRKRYKCEGSLISASYVITVAHCVSGLLSLFRWHLTAVRLGEWNPEENSDCTNGKNADTSCTSKHINVAIEYAVPHSLYSLKAKNQQHDIALLRLAEVVNFTDFVKPICLPLNKEERIIDFKNLIMEEADWNPNFVKIKASVQGVAARKCHHMRLKNSQFCVESQEPRYSLRKLGGPAVILCPNSSNACKKTRPHYTLAGILSFYVRSDYCPIKVYTKIQDYVGWILETIKE